MAADHYRANVKRHTEEYAEVKMAQEINGAMS